MKVWGITNAEFDALVGDMVTTLIKFTVGKREHPSCYQC
jgi:hypothetical protein